MSRERLAPAEWPEQQALHVDAGRRARLASALDFVASIHHHIDPDRFDIDLAWLEPILELLRRDPTADVVLRATYDDVFRLGFVVDAAATYAARPGYDARRRSYDPLPTLDDEDYRDLEQWLAEAETVLFRARPRPVH